MKAQIAMTGLVCLSVMMLIVLAVALHHPFTGDVSVSSEPIERVIELMEALSPDVAH